MAYQVAAARHRFGTRADPLSKGAARFFFRRFHGYTHKHSFRDERSQHRGRVDHRRRPPISVSASMTSGPGPSDSVVNAAGEDLGEVKAIMLDVASGRIVYAVLSFGGFLGMGQQAVRDSLVGVDSGRRRKALHPEHREGATRQCAGLRQGPLALDGRRELGQAIA
jgi:PRC-barrel domain